MVEVEQDENVGEKAIEKSISQNRQDRQNRVRRVSLYRLRQLGVDSIHGVPGDYNLELLDYVQPAGLRWVGNANELNAAYAADAYSRIKGIGAVITTFGVGELSAVNAIPGAYTEFAPVVHIVGIPSRASQENRLLVHHTFNDGEYRRFAAIHAHVTVAQACLNDPRTSAEQIDAALSQCLLYSRPVYIEDAKRLQSPIIVPDGEPDEAQDEVLRKIFNRIYHARQLVIIVDGESRPIGIQESVQWPTWTTPFGKGLTDETLHNLHGIYRGSFDDPNTRTFIKESDLVLSSNSYSYSTVPKSDAAILFTTKGVRVGSQLYRDVSSKYIMSRVANDLDLTCVLSYDPYPHLPQDTLARIPEKLLDEPLTHDRLWRILANFVRPGDIVLGETGTAGYGVREMPLPPHTRVFTPVTWLSVGYMLPGAQGAALAQDELIKSSNYFGLSSAKTILFIGDGSFQMTAQEIATMIRHKLNITIFLINNDGYTIERAIHGRKQDYNNVSPWRYLKAPEFFGAKESTYTGSARTWRELRDVLGHEGLNQDKELRMVEIFVEREDCPKGPLSHFLETQKKQEVLD
ncbi:thiamine diphosphate-binding protein [Thelonectria olida]|uniref:Pyruvate decarboxylase n=1 Tax=Thelonectria olida TaxID=1576542 RepID=A0A9P8VVQ6_9HYPO|nr:thiamine diphosphate-binding protein [Thelonectria olida]